jgi:hypothetical protein
MTGAKNTEKNNREDFEEILKQINKSTKKGYC